MNYKLIVKKGDARLVVEHDVETTEDAQYASFAFRELIQLYCNIPKAKISCDTLLLEKSDEAI